MEHCNLLQYSTVQYIMHGMINKCMEPVRGDQPLTYGPVDKVKADPDNVTHLPLVTVAVCDARVTLLFLHHHTTVVLIGI